MGSSSNIKRIFFLFCFSATVFAMDMGTESHRMHGGDGSTSNESYTRPDIKYPVSRTFHWISALTLQFLLPSISACCAYGDKITASMGIIILPSIYSNLELFFFDFKDNNGKGNVVSRGTALTICIMQNCNVLLAAIPSSKISETTARRLEKLYKTLLSLTVVAGFIKVCMAPITMFGFCRGGYTGQCLAHGIMGTSFILYGGFYSLVLMVPKVRDAIAPICSQDHLDSWVMCLYGIVNTFTEHRWGREPWFMHDYQHTAMGILWWSGGILGILLSRKGKRTFVPSLLIMFTGWAMTQHHQHLEISTHVHYMFGLILTLGGALRIIEIVILLKDKSSSKEIISFQYLPPFCLVCAGILFMSANQEQLVLVLRLKAEHSSYIMVVISGAFLLYFWLVFCLEFYLYLKNKTPYNEWNKVATRESSPIDESSSFELSNF